MKTKFIIIFITIFSALIFLDFKVIAQENRTFSSPEKVTFIYIHGVNEPDQAEFDEEVKGLHKWFSGKHLGHYIINSDPKGVYWGNLSRNGTSLELFKNGLLKMNTTHNKSQTKNTIDTDILLLLNPVNKLFRFKDNGSSANAVYFRNLINNYLYDFIWIATDQSNMNKVFDIIQKRIDESGGKFVFVGHSIGSAIAVNFLMNRVILDPSDPKFNKNDYDNFAGLITGGEVSNIFNSSIWSNQMTQDDYDTNKNNFIRYFIENNKFWISYNHQNDIIATCLSDKLTSYNNRGPGFIISRVNRTFFFHRLADFFRFWDYTDTEIEAHDWMFVKPKEFARRVLKAYKKESRNKKLLKLGLDPI